MTTAQAYRMVAADFELEAWGQRVLAEKPDVKPEARAALLQAAEINDRRVEQYLAAARVAAYDNDMP